MFGQSVHLKIWTGGSFIHFLHQVMYLIVTGLSENIEEISSEKSLSFFKRADTKEFLSCIYASKTGKSEDIKKLMEKPSAYQVYRSRLINKHIVDGSTHGYLSIHLPRFDKFIELWGDD